MIGSRPDSVALAAFPLIVFGVLVFTGNATTGPRLIDENQIYKLQIEFQERGFLRTLVAHQQDRLRMKRLIPTFAAQKVVQARVLGGDFTAWKLWTAMLNAGTAVLLYAFLRLCRFSVLEALLFGLITVVGEQSIVWWRPIQGEGIGMFCLSAALVSMAIRARTGGLSYELAFALFATLAMLSKESFILAMPAVVFLKIALRCGESDAGLRQAIKHSGISLAWLTVVFCAALATVKFVFDTSTFHYAGWSGFDMERLLNIVGQYISITNAWVLIPLLGIAVWCFHPPGEAPRNKRETKERAKGSRQGGQPAGWMLLSAAVFWAVITGPQLLLYMRTGMLSVNAAYASRYILPGVLGFALLIAALLRYIREAGGRPGLALPIAAAIVVLSVAEKGWTAYREGCTYAERSRWYDEWFETIADHTTPTDRIVLVYLNGVRGGGYSLQAALRVYYLLSQRHERPLMLLHPLPPQPTLEESRQATIRRDTRHHARKLRTIDPADQRQKIHAVLILNWGNIPNWNRPTSLLLETVLAEERPAWFHPADFRRKVHPLGHITYFRHNEAE